MKGLRIANRRVEIGALRTDDPLRRTRPEHANPRRSHVARRRLLERRRSHVVTAAIELVAGVETDNEPRPAGADAGIADCAGRGLASMRDRIPAPLGESDKPIAARRWRRVVGNQDDFARAGVLMLDARNRRINMTEPIGASNDRRDLVSHRPPRIRRMPP